MRRLVNRTHIVTFIFLLLFGGSISAQLDTLKSPRLVITLKKGTKLTGRIQSAEKLHLNFLTDNKDTVKVMKDSIDEIIRVEDLPPMRKKTITKPVVKDTTASIEYEDKNLSRMVLFPTARALKAGQAYIQVNEFFLPFFAFGIADIFTLGGGVSLIPSVKQQLIYFSPKVTAFHYKDLYIAGGVFYAKWTGEDFFSGSMQNGFGISYGMGTFGDKDKSLSIGLGYGFSGKDFSNKPVMIVGTDIRISGGLKFIAEGWFPNNFQYLFGMFGFRSIGKNFSGDIVLMRIYGPGYNSTRFVPWFNITYNFDLIK